MLYYCKCILIIGLVNNVVNKFTSYTFDFKEGGYSGLEYTFVIIVTKNRGDMKQLLARLARNRCIPVRRQLEPNQRLPLLHLARNYS